MAADDAEVLAKDLRQLGDALQSQEILNKVGLAAERIIRKRTREGLDVHGDPFAPYSESYADRRERKELPTGTVNLQFSLYDGMLTTLTSEVGPDLEEVTLYFSDDEKAEIAGYHHTGAGDNPKREFFDLSDEETEKIAELIGEEIDDLLDLQNLTD